MHRAPHPRNIYKHKGRRHIVQETFMNTDKCTAHLSQEKRKKTKKQKKQSTKSEYSPGQTDSQVDASFGLALRLATHLCRLATTCADLR